MVSERKAGVTRDRSNLVIGLTGPFGSGCSTMRDILAQAPFGFRPFKMADDIRREVEQMGKVTAKGKKGWRRGTSRARRRVSQGADRLLGRQNCR